MAKINQLIRAEFKQYAELKLKRKTILNSPIKVKEPKLNHKSFKKGTSPVSHPTITSALKLEVEVKVDNSKDFKFKLFCNEVFDCPFFRFDSAGATHRNNDPDIPLNQQQITTPHFHEFNTKGIEIAYKTAALKSQDQLARLEDVNICIMHFCEEGNLRYNKKEFPEITLHVGELGLAFQNEDPLKNVNF